uniref:Uncharacterized protein n=1 Tax=Aegilops tauschii subsp. strangulata TaxID=200361 RepID=A0A453BZN7_AEGTS
MIPIIIHNSVVTQGCLHPFRYGVYFLAHFIPGTYIAYTRIIQHAFNPKRKQDKYCVCTYRSNMNKVRNEISRSSTSAS